MSGRLMPNFIEIRQGDSFTVQLQFRNNKTFLDISGVQLKMQVRKQSDNKIVATINGAIDDAVNGKAHLQIKPSDTKNLSCIEKYITDIQMTFSNGEVHTIYPAGISKIASFIVTKNVTE